MKLEGYKQQALSALMGTSFHQFITHQLHNILRPPKMNSLPVILSHGTGSSMYMCIFPSASSAAPFVIIQGNWDSKLRKRTTI